MIFSSSETRISEAPATQHFPIPRATTAAWEVIPPRAVSIPSALTIPSISSGEVSCLTSIVFSPFFLAFTTSSALKYIFPDAAPGEAGRPFDIISNFFISFSSNVGCNNCSKVLGSILDTHSDSVILPSFTISTAIFTAAFAVLFPFLVWSMNSFSFSIVNSISCISL